MLWRDIWLSQPVNVIPYFVTGSKSVLGFSESMMYEIIQMVKHYSRASQLFPQYLFGRLNSAEAVFSAFEQVFPFHGEVVVQLQNLTAVSLGFLMQQRWVHPDTGGVRKTSFQPQCWYLANEWFYGASCSFVIYLFFLTDPAQWLNRVSRAIALTSLSSWAQICILLPLGRVGSEFACWIWCSSRTQLSCSLSGDTSPLGDTNGSCFRQ